MDNQFVYHRKSKDFIGDVIYPLNQLPFLEIKVREQNKYKGREALLEVNIPPLNCLWNDVIHCSPVHPTEVWDALRHAGFTPPSVSYFAVPVSLLSPTQTIIFLSSTQPNNRYAPENYLQFTPENLKSHQCLPKATQEYYTTCKTEGRNPLVYVGIPHILYLGLIQIKDCEVIEVT